MIDLERVTYDEAIECLRAIKSTYFSNGSSKWTTTIDMCIRLVKKEKEETLNDLRLKE